MKKAIAIAAVSLSLSLICSQARADGHRPGDAALGALSGAVVFGPIGAVAGAVVGYTAGPSMRTPGVFGIQRIGPDPRGGRCRRPKLMHKRRYHPKLTPRRLRRKHRPYLRRLPRHRRRCRHSSNRSPSGDARVAHRRALRADAPLFFV